MTPYEPPKTTLKLYTDATKPLRFSYVAKNGLCLTGKAGGVIEQNILGKILTLPTGDIDKHIEFFQTYGFLLPLSSQEYESVDAEVLLEVVNRIKAITGKTHWYDAPPTTLSAAANHMGYGGTSRHPNVTTTTSGFMSASDKIRLDNATSEANGGRIVMRDSSGRGMQILQAYR